MRILKATIFSLVLTLLLSSTASAGNIAGLRTTGNIGGTRSAGNIGGARIAGMAPGSMARITNGSTSRTDFAFSGTFAGLIRMLLESGALL